MTKDSDDDIKIKKHDGCNGVDGELASLRPGTFANSSSHFSYALRCKLCKSMDVKLDGV